MLYVGFTRGVGKRESVKTCDVYVREGDITVSCGECGDGENKTGVVCRKGVLGQGWECKRRGENECRCGWEPCATVGAKRNKMSMHMWGGNEYGEE